MFGLCFFVRKLLNALVEAKNYKVSRAAQFKKHINQELHNIKDKIRTFSVFTSSNTLVDDKNYKVSKTSKY